MANDKHIEQLLKGVDSWNGWRAEANHQGNHFTPDFRDADLWDIFRKAGRLEENIYHPELGALFIPLSGADLNGADFTNANLSYADLRLAHLGSAHLNGTNLTASEPWRAYLGLYWDDLEKVPTHYRINEALVESVQDLLTEIQNIERIHAKDVGDITLYFRGEFESGWPLKPSVMRGERVLRESEMLVDLIARRPGEFNELPSALARWVLAAHHGLPTRFLDITSNPLVALFHSCDDTAQREETEKENGRLHVFAISKSLVKTFDSDVVSIIANFARLKRHQQHTILGLVDRVFPDGVFHHGEPEDWHKAMRILYQLIRQEKPYFGEWIDPRELYRVFVVEPQQSSERIWAQAGAFLVSAFHEQFEHEGLLNDIPETQTYAHCKLTVSGDKKKDIVKQLKSLGISRETLYPGLDSSAKAVKESYENR